MNNTKKLGHKQGPALLHLDNKTAVGIINNNVKQRRYKAMDIQFYWVCKWEQQKDTCVYWKLGSNNKADYPSKHHPIKHYQAIYKDYVINQIKKMKYQIKFGTKDPIKNVHGIQ